MINIELFNVKLLKNNQRYNNNIFFNRSPDITLYLDVLILYIDYVFRQQ